MQVTMTLYSDSFYSHIEQASQPTYVTCVYLKVLSIELAPRLVLLFPIFNIIFSYKLLSLLAERSHLY